MCAAVTVGVCLSTLGLMLSAVGVASAADGDLDSSFNGIGSRVLGVEAPGANSSADEAFDIVRDAQGRYYVFLSSRLSIAAGSGPRKIVVMRLTSTGALDNTFGTAGRVEHDTGMVEVEDAEIDSQGRLLVGGTVLTAGTVASAASAVLRLTASGQRDSSWGQNGLAGFDFPNSFEEVRAVRVDTQNNVLVGGDARDSAGNLDFDVVRLRAANGAPDTTFGSAGLRRIGFDIGTDKQDALGAMVVMSDGRIVVVGAAFGDTSPVVEGQLAIARLTANGAFDTTFCATAQCVADSPPGNSGGKRAIEVRLRNGLVALPIGVGVAIDGVGGIVISGESLIKAPNEEAGFLLRLDSQGDLDRSFGDALSPGFRSIAVDRAHVFPKDVLIDSVGRISVVGFVKHEPQTTGASAYFATRFLVNGATDDVFASGPRSYAEYTFGNQVNLHLGHALLADRRLLIAARISGNNDQDGLVFALGGDVIFGGPGADFE